jgi:hypothetical protein
VAKSTSSLSWIEWILKRKVKVNADEQLNAQVYQSKSIDLRSKNYNNNFEDTI